jgi:hypothetical protein
MSTKQKELIVKYWEEQRRLRSAEWNKLREIVIFTDKATDHRIMELLFEILEKDYGASDDS